VQRRGRVSADLSQDLAFPNGGRTTALGSSGMAASSRTSIRFHLQQRHRVDQGRGFFEVSTSRWPSPRRSGPFEVERFEVGSQLGSQAAAGRRHPGGCSQAASGPPQSQAKPNTGHGGPGTAEDGPQRSRRADCGAGEPLRARQRRPQPGQGCGIAQSPNRRGGVGGPSEVERFEGGRPRRPASPRSTVSTSRATSSASPTGPDPRMASASTRAGRATAEPGRRLRGGTLRGGAGRRLGPERGEHLGEAEPVQVPPGRRAPFEPSTTGPSRGERETLVPQGFLDVGG
jgi:hypothetical protein